MTPPRKRRAAPAGPRALTSSGRQPPTGGCAPCRVDDGEAFLDVERGETEPVLEMRNRDCHVLDRKRRDGRTEARHALQSPSA